MNSLLTQAGIRFASIPAAPFVVLLHRCQQEFCMEFLHDYQQVPCPVRRLIGFTASFPLDRRVGQMESLLEPDGRITLLKGWAAVLSQDTRIPDIKTLTKENLMRERQSRVTLLHDTTHTPSIIWT